MQLPVDIGALLEEAVNVEAARATPLSVSVYVDETAPGDVAAHVRQAFASASDTARVSLIYLDGREFAPSSEDDMACIVAGLDENVGAYARACRKAGVPAMVVTTLPQLVGAIAKAAGCAIPEADIVAPKLTAKVYEHVSTAAGQGPRGARPSRRKTAMWASTSPSSSLTTRGPRSMRAWANGCARRAVPSAWRSRRPSRSFVVRWPWKRSTPRPCRTPAWGCCSSSRAPTFP